MFVHTEIEIAELHELLEDDARSILLIDVRRSAETRLGKLPGAINIPLSELPARLDELPVTRRLVLYSNTGRRSAEACALLHAAGYRNLCHLRGGISSWRSSGLQVA